MIHEKTPESIADAEPSVSLRFLPGCRSCGHRHPLAMKPPPQRIDICPRCEAVLPPMGDEVKVPAKVSGGIAVFIARYLLKFAKWLRTFER